jgi:DNA topoisomerase III
MRAYAARLLRLRPNRIFGTHTYLAALMPDFRYRQTTATLDVRGFEFRAAGRQPIDFGWRAAFPEWQPAEEKGDEAQLLPPLRNGETAQLQNAKIEDKETRPPPRYNEGTLIAAMQNAWRFVDDEVLRERLKEAKGIGTPATRAEIIGGLKKQGFLIAQGKHIVPTEAGLSLFGILKQADPALVDPGATAQLEPLATTAAKRVRVDMLPFPQTKGCGRRGRDKEPATRRLLPRRLWSPLRSR